MEAPSCNLQDLMSLLLTSWCQTPQNTFRWSCGVHVLMGQSCFGRHKGDLHNIRHNMLWLIGVHIFISLCLKHSEKNLWNYLVLTKDAEVFNDLSLSLNYGKMCCSLSV